MTKLEFLEQLRKGLSGLPQIDIDERLTFYSEMIDDRMEEGLSEEVAVSEIGSVHAIVSQIIADIPLAKAEKEKTEPKKTFWITLLVLGSPVWVSLLVAAFAVILSLYVALWAVIISLWATEASLWGSAIGGVIAGSVFAFNGNFLSAVALIGASIFCAGLSIFLFYGCKAATKGALLLTKKVALLIKKNLFGKKGEA